MIIQSRLQGISTAFQILRISVCGGSDHVQQLIENVEMRSMQRQWKDGLKSWDCNLKKGDRSFPGRCASAP